MNHIGIDVDSENLVCCIQPENGQRRNATFANQPSGYRRLARWALKHSNTARICMEATGVYSLPLALYLEAEDQIDVMVVNPRAIKNFAMAILQRGKTDRLDAQCMLEYVLRMDFQVWSPPTEKAMEIQHLSRRIGQIKDMRVQENNRLKAASRLGDWTLASRADIEAHIEFLTGQFELLNQALVKLIEADAEFSVRLRRLRSVVGIADQSGSRLLAELSVIPAELTSRQWVAHAGLDPRPHESGSSTHKPRRISRAGNSHIRDGLYFPALVAIRHEPHVNAFYESLLVRGKKKKQAIVAVMRKLLLAIWGMFKNGEDWKGEKFYRMA